MFRRSEEHLRRNPRILVSTLTMMYFSNDIRIKNCIVHCEHGVSDVRLYVTAVMRSPCHFLDIYIEERATVKSQMSLLDLTIESGIPDDVMWPLMDGKHIVSVPHHDGLLVDRVNDGLDEEIDGTSITSPTQTHNILQHSKAKKTTIFNNGRYTTNIPTDTHTVTTTDIKTNMRHIYTSIVSRHLATRGNNKILRTPPPHTMYSSSEEILPRLTRRTLAQLRTNKSPFLKSYLHKVDAKTHPSPLCPLCNIHTHDTHHLFNCTHIRTTLSPLDL